jgi:hypothetical protein
MARRIPMTYDIARAVGTDAANARMRWAGRTAWDQEDYSLAVRTMDALLGPPTCCVRGGPLDDERAAKGD